MSLDQLEGTEVSVEDVVIVLLEMVHPTLQSFSEHKFGALQKLVKMRNLLWVTVTRYLGTYLPAPTYGEAEK